MAGQKDTKKDVEQGATKKTVEYCDCDCDSSAYGVIGCTIAIIMLALMIVFMSILIAYDGNRLKAVRMYRIVYMQPGAINSSLCVQIFNLGE